RELLAVLPWRDPGNGCLSGARHEDAGQHLDRGGFPGAVRADVADHLATFDLERDVVDGGELLVRRAVDEAAKGAERAGVVLLDREGLDQFLGGDHGVGHAASFLLSTTGSRGRGWRRSHPATRARCTRVTSPSSDSGEWPVPSPRR